MPRTVRSIVLAAILTAVALPAVAAEISSTALKAKMKQMMEQNPQLRQELMSNPNHRLAMAYRHNLLNFAVALDNIARNNETTPGEVVRTAVKEMRRSADLLEKQHNEVLSALPAEKKAALQDVPKLMQQHLADMRKHLDRLDEIAKGDRVPSSEVRQELTFITEGCRMDGMHGAMMPGGHGKGMLSMMMQGNGEMNAELQDLVNRMNEAPDDQKLGIMSQIITRLVEQQTEMGGASMEMLPHGSHPMMQHPQMNYGNPPAGTDDDTNMDMDEVMDEME
ncbi:hypothetical protein [Geotalea sp. SG265]|uniref:hypothetical protein n=1 Tax=Geotalea sp. SG265 TaxID=2922867 RepID=UPI001FAF466C|nr:hypothetical protein [Geotalea sp. SG265]